MLIYSNMDIMELIYGQDVERPKLVTFLVYPTNIIKYTGSINVLPYKTFRATIEHEKYTKNRTFKTRNEAFEFIKRKNIKHGLPIGNIIELFPDCAKVELTRGLYMICNVDDIDLVQKHNWHATTQGYAATNINGKIKKFHNIVIGFTLHDDITVDHLNRNKLDNRIENLFEATPREQATNQGTRKDNTSGIKGVSLSNGNCNWTASWSTNNKQHHKKFSINKYGGKEALELAIAYRKAMEIKYYNK